MYNINPLINKKSYWELLLGVIAESMILKKRNAFSWDPYIRLVVNIAA